MRKNQKHTQEAIKKQREGSQKSIATRRAQGKIRALEAPENRLKNTIIWLARFGGRSTKKLLIKNGATSNDFAIWSRNRFIEYQQREFKITHRAESQLISVVKLTSKGWRKAKEYGHPRENVYFQELHFSHDLIVQSYILRTIQSLNPGYTLYRYMTGEEIAGKAWKKEEFNEYHWGENTCSTYRYFDRQKNAYIDKSFKYDGLLSINMPDGPDGVPIENAVVVIELERQRKKESEYEHFEAKYNAALEPESPGANKRLHILVQNGVAKKLWKDKIESWGDFGGAAKVRQIDAKKLLGME